MERKAEGRYNARVLFITMITSCLLVLNSCQSRATPTTIPTAPPAELVLFDWPDDIAPEVLSAFTAETGIAVRYVEYGSVDEAAQQLRSGAMYDVVVLTNEWVAKLTSEGLLAEIDYANVPNFRYISANFRDLAYDPQNRHAIPFNWGATTIAYRSDLITTTLTNWSDLWNSTYQGPIVATPAMRDLIGSILKGLGFSVNSEDPAQLASAREQLLKLRPRMILLSDDEPTTAPYLINGSVPVTIAQPRDVLEIRRANVDVLHVYPQEGAILWGDNFVIPLQSKHKASAERLLDYFLRPEVAAKLVEYNLYPTPNDGALDFIDPELAANEVIFPPAEVLHNAEVLLPISAEANELYLQIWQEFLAEPQ